MKVAFITLGCKVNQYETNSMTQEFIKNGYEIVEHTRKSRYIHNKHMHSNKHGR